MGVCVCVCQLKATMNENVMTCPVLPYPPICILDTEVRCAESAKIRGKYQDRIPVSD